jgi:rhodanese-related sulfurtransferase
MRFGRKSVTTGVIDVVIVLCLAGTGWRLLASRPPSATSASPSVLRPGAKLVIDGIDWNRAAVNVLLFVSTSCDACVKSVGFYGRLTAAAAQSPGVRVIVASQEADANVREWLSANHVVASAVVRVAQAARVGFIVTPTVLLVDSAGVVKSRLASRLLPEEQALLVAAVKTGAAGASVDNMPELVQVDVASRLAVAQQASLVDVEERGPFNRKHLDGELNIPLAELAERASHELSVGRLVIVDCGTDSDVCVAAAETLRTAGFARIMIVAR